MVEFQCHPSSVQMRTPFSLEGQTELVEEGKWRRVGVSEVKDRRTNPGASLVSPVSLLAAVCSALAWADFFLIAGDESSGLTVTRNSLRAWLEQRS